MNKCTADTNNEQMEEEEEEDLQWPTVDDYITQILSCTKCFFPIVKWNDVITIRNEQGVYAHILKFNQSPIHETIVSGIEQVTYSWQRKYYCPNCGLQLTFNTDTVPGELREWSSTFNTEMTIFDETLLVLGYSAELKMQYEED